MARQPKLSPESILPARREYGAWSIGYVKARDCWRVRPPKSVDPKRKPHYEKTRELAEAWATTEQARLAKGPGVHVDDITAGDYFGWWIATVAASKRWSIGTTARYEADGRRLGAVLLAQPLRLLTRLQVQSRVAHLLEHGTQGYQHPPHERGLAPISVVSAVRTWRAALADAVDEYELLDENPAARLKLPDVVVEEAETWTEAEVTALLRGYRGHRHEVVLGLMLGASIRIGEALAVRWIDVDWQQQRLGLHATGSRAVVQEHTKSRRRRWVPISAPLLALLRRQQASQEWAAEFICEHQPGRRWSYSAVRAELAQQCIAIGVRPLTTHAARHHAASHLSARGLGIAVVSRILGHSSVAITAKYLHGSDAEVERAGPLLAELFDGMSDASEPLDGQNGATLGATRDDAPSSQEGD
jgi:integrase